MTAPEETKYTLVCTCGAQMLITAAYLGKTGKCGQCGAVITASPENTTPMAAVATTAPRSR